jgi:signal peptidase I
MTPVATKPQAAPAAFRPENAPPLDESASPGEGLRRLVDFLAVVFLAAVVFKAFVAEGYYVPTGSMAPRLLGFHHRAQCGHCGYEFEIGAEDRGGPPSAPCPMCRKRASVDFRRLDAGDRLLVLKWSYEFQKPKRWETVVFRNPNDAGQVYIKRVVGLPGESVSLQGGDVFIDGRIACKSFEQFRAVRLLVYDHDRASRCLDCAPRFAPESTPCDWRLEANRLEVDARGARAPHALAYVHVDSQGRESAVTDDNPYNGFQNEDSNKPVSDLAVEFRARHLGGDGWLGVRWQPSTTATVEARLFPSTGRVEVYADGRLWKKGHVAAWPGASTEVAVSYWDQRLAVRVHGGPAIPDAPLDSDATALPSFGGRPFVLSAEDSGWTIDQFRVYRDVHYRSDRGAGGAHQLAADEYYMLGDNSPISNDSRRWSVPAVPANLLVGKPLWVHLPTFSWRGTFWGRPIQLSIPDPSRMRRVE